MIASGFLVFCGIFLLLLKLPRRKFLWLLGHDLVLDITVTCVTLALHFGTFSGIMAATFAGLLTSLASSGLKRLFGSIRSGNYTPGYFKLEMNG